MIKIVKTIAVAVAVTCMFAMSSGEASAQCARGGFGGFNSGIGYGNVGGFYSSGYRGGGFNSGYGGFNRGLSVNINTRPSIYGSRSNLYRSSGRSYSNRGRYGY